MIKLSNYLMNLDLKELLEVLEKDDDIENILIILQMFELNNFAEMESLKEELEKDDEEEDDLLEDNKKTEEEKKRKQDLIDQAQKKQENTHSVIQSIIDKPMDFWQSNEPSAFANSLLGTIIVPSDKQGRSAVAGGILFGIVKAKNKNLANENNVSREKIINIVRELKKTKAEVLVI